jgi:hypothetical protein
VETFQTILGANRSVRGFEKVAGRKWNPDAIDDTVNFTDVTFHSRASERAASAITAARCRFFSSAARQLTLRMILRTP